MKEIKGAGVAIIQEGKLLVLYKTKDQHYEFPGGKAERGETLKETATREAYEEIACAVENLSFYKEFRFERTEFIFRANIFLAALKEEEQPINKEPERFDRVEWIEIKDYKNFNLSPPVQMFVEDYLRV